LLPYITVSLLGLKSRRDGITIDKLIMRYQNPEGVTSFVIIKSTEHLWCPHETIRQGLLLMTWSTMADNHYIVIAKTLL
jgi:hypothetical protein